MIHLRGLIFALALFLGASVSTVSPAQQGGSASVQKGGKQRKKQSRTAPRSPGAELHDRLVGLKKSYRLGEIGRRAFWEKLDLLHDRGREMMDGDRISLLQTQATLLHEGGYPILAAIYASQALKIAQAPLDRDLTPSWSILRQVSERRPIQSVLEIVADQVELNGRNAPVFGSEWAYVAGNAAARRDDLGRALSHYSKVEVNDRYFFPARYQQALLLVEMDRLKEAESALKAILFPASHKLSPLREDLRRQLVDYAYLALGRIYYEQGRFAEAIRAYRSVDRKGANFYDALFEQAWAFFMGGHPMHALGALHGAESPFYAEVFNPEATMLRSLIHYWLCRYEDSRNALADFMEKHGDSVERLNEYLDRQRLDPETAYQLFENLVSGVSSESLGLPKAILSTAAERDSMLLVRDQFASVLEEKSRLEANGVFGSKSALDRPMDYLDRWATALRKDIGKRFLAELQDMKKDYDRLYAQAQFLYVELLMSEKEQLLGKELHASSKITKVTKQLKVGGWADKTQSWKDSRNGEYWWDEVGFYITPVDSMCTAAPGKK